MNKIKVIGAIGQNGSGKDEILKYLKIKYNIPFLSTGEVVREIARKEGLETTRENLGKISERYFREFGKGCFVKTLAETLQQSRWPVAGISGIRSLDDVRILKDVFGKDFILIRVHVTDDRVRFDRMTARNEERDPHSFEQFRSQEAAEEKLFHIKEAEQIADFTIRNDGTLDDMHRQIDKMVKEKAIPTVAHNSYFYGTNGYH